ncbi:uncharacterized protein LOC128233625 [Mya arenaria]|uniref:uncharacterized protein LOC128233625 n=1 Tax=Mya arenaria TaxID=6604 RepID=UPI0022E39612|nr:uncharacterized protein LOC128233625 [Mya arenaria]
MISEVLTQSPQSSTSVCTALYGWSDLSGSCSFKWFRDIEVKQHENVPPRVKGCLFASDSQSSSLMISEVLTQSPQSSTSVCTALYGWSDLSGSCSFKWFRDIEVKQHENVPPRVKGCLFASDSQSSSLMISEVLTQSPQSSTSVCTDEMPYTGDPTEDSRQNSSIHLKCHCLFEKRYLSTLVRFKILFVLYVLCTVAFCLSVILQHLYFVFYMNIENLSYSKSFRK